MPGDLADLSDGMQAVVGRLEDAAREILREAQQLVGDIATGRYMRSAAGRAAVSDGPSFNDRVGEGTLRIMGGRLSNSLRGARTDRAAPEGISRIAVNIDGSGATLIFGSAVPYARIHEHGGTIPVTEAMRGFFWAKYYEAGADRPALLSGAGAAAQWKALALGAEHKSRFRIPARPYLEPALEDARPKIRKLAEETLFDTLNASLD
jgi:phage gpG-like protein